MARRRHLRVKMRSSLHGVPIAIPNNMDKNEAATILKSELQPKTPIKTGRARSDWNARELANGDVRVGNTVPYIRRLMIDGSSKQQRGGAHNRAIALARVRIKGRGKQLEAVEEFLTGKVEKLAQPQVRGQIVPDITELSNG